jgi:hypothetical protein
MERICGFGHGIGKGKMIKTFLSTLLGAVLGGAGVELIQRMYFTHSSFDMSYSDLAATILAATAVILAVLGFFIAVAALLGWAEFRGLTKKAAETAAKDRIDERLDNGDIRAHFEELTDKFLKSKFESKSFQELVLRRVDNMVFARKDFRRDDEGDENEEN